MGTGGSAEAHKTGILEEMNHGRHLYNQEKAFKGLHWSVIRLVGSHEIEPELREWKVLDNANQEDAVQEDEHSP